MILRLIHVEIIIKLSYIIKFFAEILRTLKIKVVTLIRFKRIIFYALLIES